MPVIGIAEVLVKPSFKGVQSTVSKEMTGAADSAGASAGKSAGSKMAASLGKSLKVGALAAGAAVTGVLGTAIVKGFNRLSAIEQAKAKLAGLGNSAKDVSAIMDNAMAAVKGTAFGMDEAATVSASAVAAGIKPGKELEKTLRLVGDAATIGGTSMSEMGAIFNKVAASNKLQGDSIAQLQDRGIPILQLLGKSLGKTSSEVADMASKGKIDFATFQSAMEAGLGGAAQKSGNTTVGAFKNMNAALSRFGAALLQDIFPLIGPVFNKITAGIDSATKKVKPFVASFMGGMQDIFNLIGRGDFTGLFGLEEDSKIVGALLTIREKVFSARDAVDAFVGGWQNAGAVVLAGGLTGAMLTFGAQVRGTFDSVAAVVGPTLRVLADTFGPIAGQVLQLATALSPLHLLFTAFLPVLPQIITLVGEIAASLGDVLAKILPVAVDLVGKLAQAFGDMAPVLADLVVGALQTFSDVLNNIPGGADTLAGAVITLTVAIGGYKVATAAATAITKGLAAAKAIVTGITQGYNAAMGISTVMTRAQAAATAQGTAGFYAMKAAQIATMAVTKPLALAQMALNAVMNNNPIGKIIMLVSALVAGLVWFFTQTQLGKDIIANVWGFIQSAIAAVGDWFTNTLVPAFQAAVKWVGDAFTWLYENVIKPVFDGVAAVVGWAWSSVIKPVFDGVMAVVQAVGGWFSWLYNDILDPVFQMAGALIGFWWNNIAMPVFNAVVSFVRDTLGAIFSWFYNSIIKPVWDAVGAAIGWVWNNVVLPVFQAIQTWIGNVGAVVNWLYTNVIKPVWDAIGTAINWVWSNVILPVFQAIQNTINTVGSVIGWLYNNVVKPQFDAIGKAIAWVWDNVIKPVFDTLSDVIQKKIPDAFEKGKNFIGDIWKGIQDLVKAPIKFVVNTVLNDGLIGAFNTVADFLHTKRLGRINIPGITDNGGSGSVAPPGRAFAVGGYTGDGGKYEPKGVVHGGEFVFTKEQTARAGVGNLYRLAASLAGYASGGFVDPLRGGLMVTQGYNRVHKGIDYAAGVGTPVFAANTGRVSWAGPGVSAPGVWGGNEVHILGDGIETWYAHLSSIGVKLGEMVRAGQQIALSGNTGISSGPHLHFGVFQGGWPNDIDPSGFLSGQQASGKGFNPIAGIIDGLMNAFKGAFPGGGFVVDLVGDFAKNMLTMASDAVMNLFGGNTDKKGAAMGVPHLLRDQGGVLPPGLSAVLNKTGGPEWVFNREQLGTLNRAVTSGGPSVTINGNVGWDPHEVAYRLETKQRDALAMAGIY